MWTVCLSNLVLHFHGVCIYIATWCWCGEGSGNAVQYACLENPMDGGAWWAAVLWVSKSPTRPSDFTFTFHALQKEMATHSSVLAWRIPGTGEPGGLPSMGLHRVRRDWSDLAAAAWHWWLPRCLLGVWGCWWMELVFWLIWPECLGWLSYSLS